MDRPPADLGNRRPVSDRIKGRARVAHSGRLGELGRAVALDQVARCNRLLVEWDRLRAAILERREFWQAEAE
jgi:hypothetical protein